MHRDGPFPATAEFRSCQPRKPARGSHRSIRKHPEASPHIRPCTHPHAAKKARGGSEEAACGQVYGRDVPGRAVVLQSSSSLAASDRERASGAARAGVIAARAMTAASIAHPHPAGNAQGRRNSGCSGCLRYACHLSGAGCRSAHEGAAREQKARWQAPGGIPEAGCGAATEGAASLQTRQRAHQSESAGLPLPCFCGVFAPVLW